MLRAVIYIRVSSERQAGEERTSPETQEADCRALAARKGYKVVEAIRDTERYRVKGKLVEPSGRRSDRPGWKRLLSMARAGSVDVILAWKDNRLYRGLRPAADLADLLSDRKDLRIELVHGTFDPKYLGLLAGVAAIEVGSTLESTMAGRRGGLSRGRLVGGALPLGFVRERGADGKPTGRALINESEAKAVRLILSEYSRGTPHLRIVERLDRSGVRSRKGAAWTVATIRNVIYAADRYASGEWETQLDGRSYALHYPSIIPDSLALRCAARRKANSEAQGTRRGSGSHILRGTVYCPCGWRMSAKQDRRWPNNSAYWCQRRDHGKPEHDDCPRRIRIADLDSYVWAKIEDVILHPERLREAIEERLSQSQAMTEGARAELETVEARLGKLDAQRSWTIAQAREALLSAADLKAQLQAVDDERGELERKASELRADLSILAGDLTDVEAASEVVGRAADGLLPLSVDLSEAGIWVRCPSWVANVAPGFDLSYRKEPVEGVYARRAEIAKALGTKADSDALRGAQVTRRRDLIESLVERVDVKRSEGAPGWTAQVGLLIHSDGPRSIYSSDWCRKYVL